MDKVQGFELLKTVIEKDLKHQDYKRVTELADIYYKMKTGAGLTDLLKKIVTRETDEEFKQRQDISKSIIPSALNSTQLPFQKAARKQPLLREITYKTGDKKQELEEYIGKYWGEKSLEEFLEYALIDYNYIDPNAFLITEFDAFDPNTKKAEPYPFVATSTDAIMFKYKNENLQYLIVKLPIQFTDGDVVRDGFKFTMYLGEDTIQMTQSASGIEINSLFYTYEEFTPKANKVPAARFGFIRDPETKGRTFVSVFHCVLLLLEKVMKTDSEMDLSIAFTAFPKRYAYVDKCSNKDCNSGILFDGATCGNCHGTGQEPIHSGVKDVVTLTMPRNPADMIELSKLSASMGVDTETLTFMDNFVTKYSNLIFQKMFNNEVVTKSEVAIAVTATESNFNADNMNDTLYPFARAYSALWEFVVTDIATFTDLSEGLTVHHKFPNDFKFKSVVELMNELKVAKDAGASTSTIAAIEDDINEILYSDRPQDLKKIKIKSLMNPFRGYSEGSVRLLISQGKTTEFNEVLWSNLESIFNDLELEFPELYELTIKLIRDKVKVKTEEYITKINSEVIEPITNPFNTQNNG
jgi:hypothetical protein